MLFTIMYNFADIVLVAFPFTNLQARKQRPAVIISSDDYNRNRPDIILMAITSQIRTPLDFGEVQIEQWHEAGLLKLSVFKPLIATIEQTQIIKQMGSLQKQDTEILRNILLQVLR
jgi:mRNA interferase MazF